MRALQLHPDQPWPVLAEVPTPTPRPSEVLLRVLAAGICRTDIHLIQHYRQELKHSLTLGHEIAGEVVATGGGGGSLRPGDRVLAHHKIVCGTCQSCTRGRETLCLNARVLGVDRDGGFAEYVVTDANRVVPLPPSVSPAAGAALTCGGVTAYHALRSVAQLLPSETVMVLGTGGVGLFAVQIAKRAGAEVIAADVRAEALSRATHLGAVRAIQVSPDKVDACATELRTDSIDVVLDLVGDPELAGALLPSLRSGGRYVVTSGGRTDRISVEPFPLFRKELGVLGSRGSSFEELKEVVRLAAEGTLDSSITAEAGLAEGVGLLQQVARGEIVGRAVIMP